MASLTELSFNWTGFISAMVANFAFTYRSLYLKKAMVRSLRHCLLSVSSMFCFHFIGCESVSIEGGELNREIVKFPLFLLIHVSNFDAVMKCFLKLRMHPQETTGFELNRLIRFQQKWILKYPRKPGLHSPFALVAQLILQPIPWKNLLYGPLWNCRMELMSCVVISIHTVNLCYMGLGYEGVGFRCLILHFSKLRT